MVTMTTESYLMFFALLLMAVYTNYQLGYLLSVNLKSPLMSRVVFTGLLLPLQMLFSGFIILINAMPWWCVPPKNTPLIMFC